MTVSPGQGTDDPSPVPRPSGEPACAPRDDIARIVRNAARSAECPLAIFFRGDGDRLEVDSCCGVDPDGIAASANPILLAASRLHEDPLILNDLRSQPGFGPQDGKLFGEALAPVRFVAAARVKGARGETRGILLVGDPLPHAGLTAAQSYVLGTQSAELSAALARQADRAASGPAQSGSLHRSNTERLRLLESVVVHANDSVLITEAEPIDLPGPRVVYCNAAFVRTTGYAEAEILGRTPRMLQSDRTDRAALAKLRAALASWQPIEVELLNHRKDGSDFWVELSIVPVADEDGWFTHWISVQRDVTHRKIAEEVAVRARIAEAEKLSLQEEIGERKRVEARLLYTAFHDDLTKLRNRAYFMNRLTIALDRVRAEPDFRCAVLFMDLDRFKLVNDSLGHRAGDLLLMEMAQRLKSCTRPQDTLARVGGDEFAILIEGAEEMSFILAVARRIVEATRRPVWLGRQEIFSSCSIGLVQAASDHELPEELLRDADIAMYQAKRNGSGGYAVFESAMHDSAVEAFRLQTDLQNAIAHEEFYLEYQPVCDAETERLVGLEALVRWMHPQRGPVYPGAFIATAEETGLIREIGFWVLRHACAQMRAWQEQFADFDLWLSVNVSGEALKDDGFNRRLRAVLEELRLDPRRLQLEFTETVFFQDPEHVERVLGDIRALGVRIALDDFGTGYSSLSYLDRYGIDTLKIDRSFLASMLTRPRTMAIVEAVVQLGHALELDIVAEGVEDREQLRALLATGCLFVQGFLLGRPVSAAQTGTILAGQFANRQPVGG